MIIKKKKKKSSPFFNCVSFDSYSLSLAVPRLNKAGHPVRRHNVSRFGLDGKRKEALRLSFLSFLLRKVVICGHCLVTLSITSYWNIKIALIAAHLNNNANNNANL